VISLSREIPIKASALEYLADRNGTVWTDTRSEELRDLQAELVQAMNKVATRNLTEKQLEVYRPLAEGYSQKEIATKLNLSAEAINKRILGSLIYSGPSKGKRHGGLMRRLQRLCLKDAECIKILKKINDLKERTEDDELYY
jgi:FixJ family two-component response regulator